MRTVARRRYADKTDSRYALRRPADGGAARKPTGRSKVFRISGLSASRRGGEVSRAAARRKRKHGKTMPKQRIVITGLGVISPFGDGIAPFWDAISNGKNGIGPVTLFDATELNCRVAAECRDFDATKYMDPKEAKRSDRYTHLPSPPPSSPCGTPTSMRATSTPSASAF